MTSIASLSAYPALACAVLLTLSNVFMTFDYLWAGLCLLGAVCFTFRT